MGRLKTYIEFMVTLAVVILLQGVSGKFGFNTKEKIIFYIVALTVYCILWIIYERITDRIARNKILKSYDEEKKL